MPQDARNALMGQHSRLHGSARHVVRLVLELREAPAAAFKVQLLHAAHPHVLRELRAAWGNSREVASALLLSCVAALRNSCCSLSQPS